MNSWEAIFFGGPLDGKKATIGLNAPQCVHYEETVYNLSHAVQADAVVFAYTDSSLGETALYWALGEAIDLHLERMTNGKTD